MTIIKLTMHKRLINLNFPVTALTFGFKVWSTFGGNCTQVRRLTAVRDLPEESRFTSWTAAVKRLTCYKKAFNLLY